ncbi:MAG: hypothetical protein ACM3SQ_11385 [Betaproteobacteria bacterium]
MNFARRVFLLSGIWGIVVLAPMYFLEGTIGQRTPPPVTHPEYYYGFVGVGLVWQLLFLMISYNPVRYRPVMLIAILEKVSFGLAVPMLFAAHRVDGWVFVGGLIDLAWAVSFAVAYGKMPAETGIRN